MNNPIEIICHVYALLRFWAGLLKLLAEPSNALIKTRLLPDVDEDEDAEQDLTRLLPDVDEDEDAEQDLMSGSR